MILVKTKENKLPRVKSPIIIFIVIFFSIISTILLISDSDRPSYYTLLPILPCSFGLVSCIFANLYNLFFKSISITMIISTYFIRLVIIPIFLNFGGYSTKVINTNAFSYIENAILLMVLELFIVFFYLSFKAGKYLDYKKNINQLENMYINNTKSSLWIIISALLLFVVLVIIKYPEELSYLGFFTQLSETERILNYKKRLYAQQVVPGAIDTFFTLFISILQIIIPILCILYISKKYGNKNKKKAANLSIIVVLLSAVIMTSEKASSVTIAVSLFIIIYNLYPSIMKKKIPFFIIVMISFVFGGLIFKAGANTSENFLDAVSTTLNAYFSGPINIAVSFMIRNDLSLNIILSDLGNSIPIVKYFFQNLNTSPKLFNLALYGNSDIKDQIIPLVGQGYFYFGFFLAPILSILVVKLTLFFERLVRYEKNILNKYIYTHATLAISLVPVLYNLNIMINTLFILIITILITNNSNKMSKK